MDALPTTNRWITIICFCILVLAGCTITRPISVTSTTVLPATRQHSTVILPTDDPASHAQRSYVQAVRPKVVQLQDVALTMNHLLAERQLQDAAWQAAVYELNARMHTLFEDVAAVSVPLEMTTTHAELHAAALMCYQATEALEAGLLGNDNELLQEASVRADECVNQLQVFERSLGD